MILNLESARRELRPLIEGGRLVIFAGAGVSVPPPSSIPTWEGLAEAIIQFFEDRRGLFALEHQFHDTIREARRNYQNNLVNSISMLLDCVKQIERDEGVMIFRAYLDWIRNKVDADDPNHYHELIVKTNYKYVLTTNYDTLFEKAAFEGKYWELIKNQYTFHDIQPLSVFLRSGQSGIIHIHGDIISVIKDKHVFTRDHYRNILFNNDNFRILLQSILVTNHVLFIGYGSTDPHIEMLLDRLASLVSTNSRNPLNQHYIVFRESEINMVRTWAQDQIGLNIITVDNEYQELTRLLRSLSVYAPRE
jgi:NAD-dependent SIR2 family protein deacetylase